MKRLAPLIPALLLSACAVGPDYKRPAALPPEQVRLTEAIENGAVTPSPLPPQWWQLFKDPELDRLVTQALAKNTDLRVAAANLQRARAVLSEAGAARLPTSGATAQFTNSQQVVPAISRTVSFDFFSVGYDASYEVDLFGGVSRSIEAARADAASAQAAVDAARVAVAAETARAYASACGFGEQADVARETEELQAKTLDLTQRRLAAGRGTQSEVDQATVLIEQGRAQVPVFEAQRRSALYALAVLIGDAPATIMGSAAAKCRSVPTATLLATLITLSAAIAPPRIAVAPAPFGAAAVYQLAPVVHAPPPPSSHRGSGTNVGCRRSTISSTSTAFEGTVIVVVSPEYKATFASDVHTLPTR